MRKNCKENEDAYSRPKAQQQKPLASFEYKIIAIGIEIITIQIRKAGSVVEPLGETVQSPKAQAAAKKRQESQ